MTKSTVNVGASVRRRLLNLAQSRGDDFQLVLVRYATERLLYRLSISPYAQHFVLKGAALFTLWLGRAHRTTRDVDLLGFGSDDPERLRQVFVSIFSAPVSVPDGVEFDVTSLKVRPIREGQVYGGQQLTFVGSIDTARISLQVDVGFGDAVTPPAAQTNFPTLLDYPAPMLRVYPRETVVAEKFDAMVQNAEQNSRMKDYFDVRYLARHFAFDGALLSLAIVNTFSNRKTAFPTALPIGLSDRFAESPAKIAQWNGFLKRSAVGESAPLADVVSDVRNFLAPVIAEVATGNSFNGSWLPGGPWSER